MHICQERQQPRFIQSVDGGWFGDFGMDAFGRLEVDVTVAASCTAQLWIGEVLSADGRINREPGGYRTAKSQEVHLESGMNHVEMELPRHLSPYQPHQRSKVLNPEDCKYEIAPFRYAEIQCDCMAEAPVFTRVAFFAPFNDDAGDFSCSDDNLNKVWNFCKYTMKATSAFGIYIDGERERQAFEGDTYINALGHYCTDASYEIARRTLTFFLEFYPIAAFEYRLFTPMLVRDYLLYSGDTGILPYWREGLEERLLTRYVSEDGLLHGKAIPAFPNEIMLLVDWPPVDRDDYEYGELNFIPNAFRYAALCAMADVTGEKQYAREASNLRQTIRKVFIKNHRFVDNAASIHTAFHTDMFALCFGLAEEEEMAAIKANLQRGVKCSVYGAQFLLEGLFANGLEGYGIELMRRDGPRSWMNMMAQGATITMEAWDDATKPNQDWCHAWGAAPANIIPRWLCGIRPVKNGFTEFVIDPHPGQLECFNFKQPTIHGSIILQKNGAKWHLEVPDGIVGRWNGKAFPKGVYDL
ncbi:MAG: hypothetical protein J6X55_00555 [Victivallales bacterium]|nr:hypothetical protein [Victivallales bacterium]